MSEVTPKRSRGRKVMRALLIVVAVLLAAVVLALLTVTLLSKRRADHTYPVASVAVPAPTSEWAVEGGGRLAAARGCNDCHGRNLAGAIPLDEPPLGRFVGSNLTGGVGSRIGEWSDEDIARAIVWGIDPDGKPLLFMPSHEYHAMPESELSELIAYIRSVNPVDQVMPASKIGPVGRMLHLTGAMPIYPAELLDHTQPRATPPDPADPLAFGEYLAAGCTGCHGAGLSGGPIPGSPPSMPVPTNITMHETGLAGYNEAQFYIALREGVRPDGTEIDPFMPFTSYVAISDVEAHAIWTYLNSLEPKPFGGR